MRAILTYHSIDTTGSVLSVEPRMFGRQMEWLANSGVRVVSVDDLLAAADTDDAVAITFDDAFANFATEAWPILRRHDFPVTVFVPTAYVGRVNQWEDTVGDMPRAPLMAWETLGALAADGVVLGAHSHTHCDLRRLPDDALQAEIRIAIAMLARETGTAPTGFAYPYGFLDDRVVAAVRARCAWACTVHLRPLRSDNDLYRLPRLDAYYFRAHRQLEAWGTARFAARMRVRGWAKALRHWWVDWRR